MNIINRAAEIKEQQFGQLVKRCLMLIASTLEEDEIRQFIQAEQNAQRQYGFMSEISQGSGNINYKSINFSFNAKLDSTGKFVAETSIQKTDTIIELPIQDPSAFKMQAEQNEWMREQSNRRKQEKDSYFRNIELHSAIANTPIEQRIHQPSLENLLKNVLVLNGIELDYEYAVKSYNQGQEKLILSSVDYKDTRKIEHKTPLFSKRSISLQPNYLKIYFPKGQYQYFKDTSLMVIPTILLLLLIIGIFSYTIIIILRQKKLSVVKNDFINNMTHELKTPISTISLASQMLRDNSVNSAQASIERISGVIFDESKRLSMQVEKVLQMAVFNEGRLKMKFKNFDLDEVITTVVKNFEIRVQSANGKITLNKTATNNTIYGDQVHITNVLFNLLDNAVKYSKENPSIEVSTDNRKNELVISVKDNGIGIAKEHQKQIFERFFRVPTGNVHDVKGFGLGLHYVSKIIDAHNGIIKIESSISKGTKFMIYFPIK